MVYEILLILGFFNEQVYIIPVSLNYFNLFFLINIVRLKSSNLADLVTLEKFNKIIPTLEYPNESRLMRNN